MGRSHVRDQWPENVGVYAFADCEDDRNAGEETGRRELRVDERGRSASAREDQCGLAGQQAEGRVQVAAKAAVEQGWPGPANQTKLQLGKRRGPNTNQSG